MLLLPHPPENVRCNECPEKDEHPQPPPKNVIVVEKLGPGVSCYIMEEEELERHGHDEPDESDGPCLARCLQRSEPAHAPDDDTEQNNACQCRASLQQLPSAT